MPNITVTLDDDNAERAALRKLLKRFASIDLSLFDPGFLGGSTDFWYSNFPQLGELFQALEKSELYYLPQSELERIRKWAEIALDLFERTKGPTLPPTLAQELIEKCEVLYNECFLPVSSAIAYSTTKSFNLNSQNDQANATLKRLADSETQVEGLVRALNDRVQKASVAEEAKHFRDEAKSHKKASYWWLTVAIVLGSVSLTVAWNSYITLDQFLKSELADNRAGLTPSQSIQLGLAKLLFFSLLIGGTIWCGRIYRAHQHNYVPNKHRQNALGTFDTIISSAQDAQTKERSSASSDSGNLRYAAQRIHLSRNGEREFAAGC